MTHAVSHEKHNTQARMDTMGNSTDSRTAPTILPVATAETIAAAKRHQRAERQRVFDLTGMRITDAGAVPLTIMHCPRPGCGFVVSALSEGRATRALAGHLVAVHLGRTA